MTSTVWEPSLLFVTLLTVNVQAPPPPFAPVDADDALDADPALDDAAALLDEPDGEVGDADGVERGLDDDGEDVPLRELAALDPAAPRELAPSPQGKRILT